MERYTMKAREELIVQGHGDNERVVVYHVTDSQITAPYVRNNVVDIFNDGALAVRILNFLNK